MNRTGPALYKIQDRSCSVQNTGQVLLWNKDGTGPTLEKDINELKDIR
jgi:hypothetical protein